MTVAAVILSATAEGAVEPLDGVARVRHLVDAAWSGGAMPVVVVSPDPDGLVGAALDGAMAELVASGPAGGASAGQVARGIESAAASVGETSAALVWPARMAWVDAATVTALIEAHALQPDGVLRPAFGGAAGWPLLVPLIALDILRSLDPTAAPERLADDLAAAGMRVDALDLGDPGTTHDIGTPREALPVFEGLVEPVAGHPPDWGAAVAPGAPGTGEG